MQANEHAATNMRPLRGRGGGVVAVATNMRPLRGRGLGAFQSGAPDSQIHSIYPPDSSKGIQKGAIFSNTYFGDATF